MSEYPIKKITYISRFSAFVRTKLQNSYITQFLGADIPAEWIFRRRFSLPAWILQGFCRDFVVNFAVDFSVDFLSFV